MLAKEWIYLVRRSEAGEGRRGLDDGLKGCKG